MPQSSKTTLSQPEARAIVKELVRANFKNDADEPFELTDGQADIFMAIYLKQANRIQAIAPTQYGKSSVIAMALIARSQQKREPFGIVTGSEPKSQIIMEKVIQHTFDSPRWYAKLELDPTEKLDRIRRSRTRKHVNWLGGGGIRTFTADARNRQRVKEALTGFGSPNLVEDEASLIPDDVQAMILRMLGGAPGGGWLLKIGNPFFRNHFLRTWQDDRYMHLFVDYHQALREGRYDQAFVDEMRGEAFFDVLYECRFPSEDEINEAGWRRLATDTQLEQAFEHADTEPPKGRPRLGVDIAAGGNNFSAYVLRYDNVMRLLEKNRDPDLMSQVGRIERYKDEFGIEPMFISVDDVGVGGGVVDRLAERGTFVNPVKEGAKAVDPDKYINLRAENYWLLGDWIKNGGKIIKDNSFYQIGQVNYKEDSSSRLKIEPKADLMKRGVASPDVADAASLTFSNSIVVTADDFDII